MENNIENAMDYQKLIYEESLKQTELLERCKIYREIYASQTGGAK